MRWNPFICLPSLTPPLPHLLFIIISVSLGLSLSFIKCLYVYHSLFSLNLFYFPCLLLFSLFPLTLFSFYLFFDCALSFPPSLFIMPSVSAVLRNKVYSVLDWIITAVVKPCLPPRVLKIQCVWVKVCIAVCICVYMYIWVCECINVSANAVCH